MEIDIKTISDLDLAKSLTSETDLAQYHSNNVMVLRQELARRLGEKKKEDNPNQNKP